MLAELAAANAAFAIIKKTIQNGGELVSAGKAIADFVNAKDALQDKTHKKRNSLFHKASGKDASDLEEFMALEAVKQRQAEIEQYMIYCGRPGLHGDWVRFQVEARKRRQREQAERIKQRQELIETCGLIAVVAVGAMLAIGLLIGAFYLWKARNGG